MGMKWCCLCAKYAGRYGNNPAPLAELPLVCCDDCNRTKVIPARLKGVRF